MCTTWEFTHVKFKHVHGLLSVRVTCLKRTCSCYPPTHRFDCAYRRPYVEEQTTTTTTVTVRHRPRASQQPFFCGCSVVLAWQRASQRHFCGCSVVLAWQQAAEKPTPLTSSSICACAQTMVQPVQAQVVAMPMQAQASVVAMPMQAQAVQSVVAMPMPMQVVNPVAGAPPAYAAQPGPSASSGAPTSSVLVQPCSFTCLLSQCV